MRCKQKYSLCCDDDLNAHVETRESQFEQRENIKFYQKVGKAAVETFEMMQQFYGEDALRQDRSKGKVMFELFFFYSNGIFHMEFTPEDATVF